MKPLAEQTQDWLDGAEDAIVMAESLLKSPRIGYSLFFGHLALEKVLKALIIEKTKDIPPRSHHLLTLAQKAGLEINAEQEELLSKASDFSLEARYQEDRQSFQDVHGRNTAALT